MKQKQLKQKNPVAKVVKLIKPSVVASKKGKGSYNRKKLAKWAQVTS